MAALTAGNPKLVKSDLPMAREEYLVLNGQSWKAGQFLFLDANGMVKPCASDAASGTGGIKYYALADQADPANATTRIDVGVITADMIFEGNELDNAVTEAMRDVPYGISVVSNIVTVDTGDTGNDAVMIVDPVTNKIPVKYSSADTLAKVYFKVLPEAINAANV